MWTVTAPRSTAALTARATSASQKASSSEPRTLRSRPRWLTERISTRNLRSPASADARPNPVMLRRGIGYRAGLYHSIVRRSPSANEIAAE